MLLLIVIPFLSSTSELYLFIKSELRDKKAVSISDTLTTSRKSQRLKECVTIQEAKSCGFARIATRDITAVHLV